MLSGHGTSSGLRVGITIGLASESETLWNNGIKQNAIFLAETLRHCPNVSSVVLVNTTSVRISKALPWDLDRWPVIALAEAKDGLDVLIELGGQVDADMTRHLKSRNARLVSYCCGFEYVHAMQSVIFGRPMWGDKLFVNQYYDAIWMVPQVAAGSQHYFQTLRRRPARTIPFVWSPVLLEQRAADLSIDPVHVPHAGPQRLTVMEPNIDVVKFCLYPILIAEEAYRNDPESIAFLHVTNAEHLATRSPEFISLMGHLDLVRNHKASFVGRYDTARFLAEFTDIVISHQWDNPLNYFYFDVCWLGYPLLHNADLCRDLGYYYPGNDVQSAAAMLRRIIVAQEDFDAAAYRQTQRSAIARFLPENRHVVETYTELLASLMAAAPV